MEIDSRLSGPIDRILSEEMKQYRDRLDAGGMQPEESVERELVMNLNGEAPTPLKISGPASLVDSLERAAKEKLPGAVAGRQNSSESSGRAPIREQLPGRGSPKPGAAGKTPRKGVQIPARRDKPRQLEGSPHGAIPLFLLPKGYSLLTKFDNSDRMQSV